MRYDVQFFTPREFVCHHCGRGHAASLLVYFLDEFRRAWSAPVLVNSAFRCLEHNKEVGGVMPSKTSKGSRHLLGCAADIAPMDLSLIGPFQNLAALMVKGRKGWELKMYPRFVHVGVPRDEFHNLWLGGPLEVKVK